MIRLRITERCARDDLELDPEDAKRDAHHLSHLHEAIRVFVGKRASAPGSGENLLNVSPYGHIKTLHIGNGRAATIFDSEIEVCWLLAYSGTHALGEKRDAYVHFERLDGRGELLPSEDDYLALETITSASLMDAIGEIGRDLAIQARSDLGTEASRTVELVDDRNATVTICIDVIVEQGETAEQGWISFILPYDSPLEETQLLDIIADLIPKGVDDSSIRLAPYMNGRPVAHNELAFTWEYYS